MWVLILMPVIFAILGVINTVHNSLAGKINDSRFDHE